MILAAEKGDITTIIGGIAPNWGPFGSLGNEAKVMIEVVMAVAILLCLGIAIWGAAKQRIGATALRDTFSAEQGKGLIVVSLTGVFIIGSWAPSSPSSTEWPSSGPPRPYLMRNHHTAPTRERGGRNGMSNDDQYGGTGQTRTRLPDSPPTRTAPPAARPAPPAA